MMECRESLRKIGEIAPVSYACSWDNVGLLAGRRDKQVSRVTVALDADDRAIEQAIANGSELLVTHHPLIFSGLKKISPEDKVGEAVIKAIKAGISIYAAHTSADKVIAGVSGAMAARLGLKDVAILDEDGDGTGLGVVGNLPEAMAAEDVIRLVKDRFGLKAMRASRPVDGMIERIALCGGSGGSLIKAARRSGAQLYISGDISYHNFFTEDGFMIMDIGHYESEIEIVDILFSLIKKNFPTFAVRITQNIYSNPIFYF